MDSVSSTIELRVGLRRIAATMFEPELIAAAGPAVLFIHGLYSDQTGYLPRASATCARLGTVCLTMDLGGHGLSEGDLNKLTPWDHLDEVITAFDYLVSNERVDRMRVCAASYGSYLAGLLAYRRRVARLLLRAPALYDDSDLDTPIGLGRKSTPNPTNALVFKGVARVGSNTLILESGKDELVPHSVIEGYLNACPTVRHAVIAEAKHSLSDPVWRAAFLVTILEWFRDL